MHGPSARAVTFVFPAVDSLPWNSEEQLAERLVKSATKSLILMLLVM
jgi:hypothetical protein